MVVVVTGVTGFGLGAALGTLLASRGASVVGAGRRVTEGEAWAQDAGLAGGDAMFVPCDVSRVDDCRRLIASAVERHGKIDALVNNAGVVGDPPFVDSYLVTEEWWDRVIDINLKGAFFCARFALEQMVPRESGIVINVASRRAVVPGPRMVAYAVSKAGIVHMGVSLAEELRGSGIRINNVVLGGVIGESNTAVSEALHRVEATAKATLAASAFGGGPGSGQLMSPSVVAEAVAALLEPACRAMSGATITIGC
jgi:NAD(P)-dependent dehydrogenase (short-subunit alcohol dehydrogenase family)